MAPLPDHVLFRPLGPADIEKVVKLEAKTIPSRECTGKERVSYWLRAAPELSAGMFVRIPPRKGTSCRKMSRRRSSTDSAASSASSTSSSSSYNSRKGPESKLADAEEEDLDHCCDVSACPRSREKLIAFIIGSKFVGDEISDEALSVPIRSNSVNLKKLRHRLCCANNNSSPDAASADELKGIGHLEYGDKIVIQAFSVDPDYQGMKLGTTILRDYIQRLSTQAVASKIVILAHADMVPFYEKLGFYDSGGSQINANGADDWHNVWISLDDGED
ncbi:hypothetical protein BZA70DRAFT_286495 [Myxozyma melibiosi]|uniref:N-acetyltransferase domain-containing protein n=1 Tax=Myxozyma melibiosi TaxID=54550 RepID=A0ABR1FBI3_9ASCO